MIRRNISYGNKLPKAKNLLDVIYDPEQLNLPVLFFIHGGSWMSGSKDMYTRLGENFLKRGFVSVIISYRLFPGTDVYGMVEDCKAAFDWCKEHIGEYGGNNRKIFLAGHSAGGHLAAVTGLSENDPSEHVSGFILIDAFGLSTYHFLTEHAMWIPEFLASIFGTDQNRWPLVSPDKLIKKGTPPFFVLTGGNTYPFLTYDNETFVRQLKEIGAEHYHSTLAGRSHMKMIYEFESPNAKVYEQVSEWTKRIILNDR